MFPSSRDLAGLENYTRHNTVQSEDDVAATFGETVRAGFDHVMAEERTDSAHRAFRPHFEARSNAISKHGGDINLARQYELLGPEKMRDLTQLVDTYGPDEAKLRISAGDSRSIDAIVQAREFARRFPGEVMTDRQIAGTVALELKARRDYNLSVLERGSGLAGFIGGAGALVTDPFIIATAPLGAGPMVGRSIAGNALRGFLAEGAVAFGAEVPIQMDVARFKAEIDSPWTFADAAFNVVAATLGAGALRAAGSVTVDLMTGQLKRYNSLPAKFKDDESEAAAKILRRIVEIEGENPLAELPEGMRNPAHEAAVVRARTQAEAGEAIDVVNEVALGEDLHPLDRFGTRATSDDVVTLSPEEILVDARRFQFKAGGDAEGVTRALAEVKRFDRSLAGQILLWQDTAGRVFVVDGHQRVGLAKRALGSGQPADEVVLSGFVLRESDGISPEDAMRVGAVRNLTASTGSALDAAKVLRGIGPAGEALLPPLPPNNALLRQGRFLARLGDEAFLAVVNEAVPERIGAIVGELIAGDAEQLAAIEALKRLAPPNVTQARVMVEQIRAAGFKKQITSDLFGEREIASSLIRERAQVVDKVLKSAREEKQTFGRLVSRGTSIEEVGENILDSAANVQKVEESGKAIEIISRLANTVGPVSEAITRAAEQLAAGAKIGDVIEPVLEAVRRFEPGGDTGGRSAGRARPGKRAAGAEGLTGTEDGIPYTDPVSGEQKVIPREKVIRVNGYEIEPDTRLKPEDRLIEDRMIADLASTPWEEMQARYAKTSEAKNGWVLSVDSARELSPDYLKDRTKSNAVHEPASAFIKRLYAERLAEPVVPDADGIRDAVTFTAGGTGAGKTTGLRFTSSIEAAAFVMDGNLAKSGSAIKKIDQALASGRRVVINYVHREPIEALVNGAFPRAMRQEALHGSGRTLDIETHASTHAGANKAIRELAKRYKDDPRVVIEVIDNSNGKGNTAVGSLDKLPEIDEAQVVERGFTALEEARANGDISEEIYQGFRALQGAGEDSGTPVRAVDQPGGARRETGAQGKGQADLLGDDTRAAQALADETRRRDTARSTGQDSTETGDPTDLFSAATRQQDLTDLPEVKGRGRPDEGGATGYVPDDQYDAVLAEFERFRTEAGEFLELTRHGVDEHGNVTTELLPASRVMDDLDAEERALNMIEECAA